MTGSRKPLKCWSLTIGQMVCDVSRMKDILDEFAKQWCFQKETGHTKGITHYQCRVILEEGQMTETLLTIFEARGIERKWQTWLPESNNSINQGGLSFYVMKDDTREEGPWYDPSYNPRKRVRYEGNDLACMDNPLPFQKKIMDMCLEEPNDRTINWIVSSGNNGKSKLMKKMRMDPAYDMARIPMGTATQIKTSIVNKGPHRIYMMDLPKSQGKDERLQDTFSAIEELKNGWVETAMYGKSEDLLMEPPHVWVFSNQWPNLKLATADKWAVWHLDENNEMSRIGIAEIESRLSTNEDQDS